jgi:deoxyribodipyrimidine photolyase
MTALLWFRRDLRLHDLPPLLDAAANGDEVLACFVLDPRLEASSGQRRMQFLCNSLRQLRNDLDGRLLVTRGPPEERIPLIAKEVGACSVHVSEDFAPFGQRRDDQVRAELGEVQLVATGSPYLVSPGRITKDDATRRAEPQLRCHPDRHRRRREAPLRSVENRRNWVSTRRCRDAATASDRLHAQPVTDDHGVVSGEGFAFAMAVGSTVVFGPADRRRHSE